MAMMGIVFAPSLFMARMVLVAVRPSMTGIHKEHFCNLRVQFIILYQKQFDPFNIIGLFFLFCFLFGRRLGNLKWNGDDKCCLEKGRKYLLLRSSW